MSDQNYRPTGELQGDTKNLPNRGTRTGLNGDTYGADLGPDATNSMGGIGSATRSDRADKNTPCHKGLKG